MGMSGSFRSGLLLFGLVIFWSLVSRFAADAFWIGIQLHHSVEFGRAADAIGALFLTPGRLLLRFLTAMLGGHPVVFAPTDLARFNGLFFGLLSYWLLKRRFQTANKQQ